MNQIKAIIFDVGGVLLVTHTQRYRRQWEKELGLQSGELEYLVFSSPEGLQAQAGIVSEERHWVWVGEQFGLDAEKTAQLQQDFFKGERLNQPLIDLIGTLGAHYQIAIISNAFTNLRQVLHTEYPISHLFDLIVASGEEGIIKPDAGIYQRTLTRLNVKPEEAIFIDDVQPNIAAAQALGLGGIHYRLGDDLTAALAQFGVAAP